MTGAEVFISLGTDPFTGLSDEEARDRASTFGPNVLPPARGRSVFSRWLDQVKNPLVLVLLGAGAVTLAIGHYVDSSVIFAVVLLNAVVGFVQESKARQALAALTTMVRTECSVIRGGVLRKIASAELVPGDVVVLEAGDRVPADGRVLETRDLECDESALTGESVAVAKSSDNLTVDRPLADRTNMVHSGTMVTRGTAKAVVVAIGSATEIGSVQQLAEDAIAPVTPLTRKLARFGRQLAFVILALAAVTFGIGVLRGSAPADMMVAAVALAVGAIPEALPAAATAVLAIGVVRMSHRRAIMRNLPAVETLGSTTVICSDKTGTITANAMTVVEVAAGGERYAVSGSGFAPDGIVHHLELPVDLLGHPAFVECLVTGVLCNDAELHNGGDGWHGVGDPTEVALLTVAGKAGLDWRSLRLRAPRVDVLPFESGRLLMATANEQDGTVIGHVKGAVERVVDWSSGVLVFDESVSPIDKEAVLSEARALAAQGLRVLACARFSLPSGVRRVDEPMLRGGLTLIGLVAMRDVPRPGVVGAVQACHDAGITVKMITGDHAETARTVASEVGIAAAGSDPVVLTGAELARITDAEFGDAATATDVFARVTPEQKLRLVAAFQQRGHVVAMTGDGVNDAPALRQADIGVAMGLAGTEVARNAADMVLADDDFTSIEAAVEEGRGAFDNLRKFITWTLPTNIAEGLVIFAAVLAGVTLPILPVQILWINMTTAVFLGLTLAFEPKETGIMRRPPRPPGRPLLTADLVRRIVLVSAVLVAGAFAVYEFQMRSGSSLEAARTAAVNVFVFAEIAFLFSCRSLDRIGPGRANRWLFGGVTLMVLLQLALTYTAVVQTLFHTAALSPVAWSLVLGVAAMTYCVVEVDKALWRSRDRRADREERGVR